MVLFGVGVRVRFPLEGCSVVYNVVFFRGLQSVIFVKRREGGFLRVVLKSGFSKGFRVRVGLRCG